jgi:transposase
VATADSRIPPVAGRGVLSPSTAAGEGGSRAEREQVARELRAEGLRVREIAERMGCALSTAGAYLSDPGGKKLAARKASYRGACVDCGAPTDGSNGCEQAPERCARCNLAALHSRQAQREGERRQLIEELWAQGSTARQICGRLGIAYRCSVIGDWRRRGYALPYRRSPETVARLDAAGRRNLTKARAVKAAA